MTSVNSSEGDEGEWDCAVCGVPMGRFHPGPHAWTPTEAGRRAMERTERQLIEYRRSLEEINPS